MIKFQYNLIMSGITEVKMNCEISKIEVYGSVNLHDPNPEGVYLKNPCFKSCTV